MKKLFFLILPAIIVTIEKPARGAVNKVSVVGRHSTFAPMAGNSKDARCRTVMESAAFPSCLVYKMAAAGIKGLQGDELDWPQIKIKYSGHCLKI